MAAHAAQVAARVDGHSASGRAGSSWIIAFGAVATWTSRTGLP
jgi:hypothetical protein